MDTDTLPRPHIGRSLLGNATRLFHQITSPQTVTTASESESESEQKPDHLTESCELTELSGEAVVLGEISREMLSGGGWGVTSELPGDEAGSTRQSGGGWGVTPELPGEEAGSTRQEREGEDEDVETAAADQSEEQQPLLA